VDAILGTGLGLAIVEKAIIFHGGTINIISEVGKGTTFRIVLPSLILN
jgi:signal transduction histidine kinase